MGNKLKEKLENKFFHRYTCRKELDSVLNGQLNFSSSRRWRKWDDHNDKALLELFEERKNRSLFICCMTSSSESIHHWNGYGRIADACRIEFRSDVLLTSMQQHNVIARPIEYIKRNDLKKREFTIDDYPFLKRDPYSVEKEFRFVKIDTPRVSKFSLPIRAEEVIAEISLSPFASYEKNERTKAFLVKKYPFLRSKFSNSKILQYDFWINHFTMQ